MTSDFLCPGCLCVAVFCALGAFSCPSEQPTVIHAVGSATASTSLLREASTRGSGLLWLDPSAGTCTALQVLSLLPKSESHFLFNKLIQFPLNALTLYCRPFVFAAFDTLHPSVVMRYKTCRSRVYLCFIIA